MAHTGPNRMPSTRAAECANKVFDQKIPALPGQAEVEQACSAGVNGVQTHNT